MFPGLKWQFPSEQLLKCAVINSDVSKNPWSLTSSVCQILQEGVCLGTKTPDDLMRMGTKKNLDSSAEYLRHLISLFSLFGNLSSTSCRNCHACEGVYVSEHVVSQIRHSPFSHGTKLIPSGSFPLGQ